MKVEIVGYEAPVKVGKRLELTCGVSSGNDKTHPHKYQWHHKQNADSPKWRFLNNKAKLTVIELVEEDSGMYRCQARSEYDKGESTIDVAVVPDNALVVSASVEPRLSVSALAASFLFIMLLQYWAEN